MTTASPAVGPDGAEAGEAGHQAAALTPAAALDLARAAYAADADHVARDLLVGLLLEGAASVEEVRAAVRDGLAQFSARRRLLRRAPGSDRGAGII